MTSVTLRAADGADAPTLDDREREDALIGWFRERGSALIGFSGGVDSAYLACVAIEALARERVLAVIGRSASYPAEQWERAREVARRFGVPVHEVDTDELNDLRYAANPTNRCYFCKTELWDTLAPIARARGLAVVVDGTNADDLSDHRPGARAAAEHAVASPLATLGFTKHAIRRLSHARGIPTWSQPASPCLSSRIPYGTAVTVDRLRQIEAAERALREVGVTGNLRVRFHGDLARIEVDPDVVDACLRGADRDRTRGAVLAAGFERVAIDLRGFRSGSLNVLGGVVAEPLVRSRPTSDGVDRDGFSRALCERGSGARVEVRDRLAVLVPATRDMVGALADRDERRRVLDTGRAHGFTHVALELGDSVADAAVSGR